VSNLSLDLFLLMSNLSQLKSRELVLSVFIDAVSSIHPDFCITYTPSPGAPQTMEIRTAKNSFGWLEIRGQPETVAPEFGGLLQNAVQMLAVILENLERERLLADENLTLSTLVDEQTHSLRESEEKYRNLFEHMAQGVVYQGTDGRIIDANPAAERLLGLSLDQMRGRSSIDPRWRSIHEDGSDFPGETHPAMVALQSGLPVQGAIMGVYNPQEDRRRWLLIDAMPQFLPGESRPYQVFATFTDITELKQASDALRLAETDLRAILNAVTESVFMMRRDGLVLVANPTTAARLGIKPEQASQFNAYEALPPEVANSRRAQVEAACESGQPVRFEDRRLEKWIENSIYPILDAQGRATRLAIFGIDITERKMAELEVRALNQQLEQRVAERTAELSQANAALQRASRAKDEFLASMSHELRTPLTGVLGLTEVLLEGIYGPLNDRQRASLKNIHESGNHLLELINDILDLAKIGAGKDDLLLDRVDVEELCQSCLLMIRQAAANKNLKVSLQQDTRVEEIMGDQRRLRQILVNLLGNAVKFTPAGGRIGLEVSGDAEQQFVRFCVWDTGIGIAPDDLARLFQPFVQLDSRLSRQYEGTGLGLALVQRLVDLHQGNVMVESEPGQGSRFTVTLPWLKAQVEEAVPGVQAGQIPRPGTIPEKASPAARPAAEPAPGSGQQQVQAAGGEAGASNSSARAAAILVAEDSPVTLKVVSDYLYSCGYQVIQARSGGEACRLASELHPTLIIMDIQMPEMNGLDAIRCIRQDPALLGTPIIALTALAMPGDRERCLKAGANQYLSKPVNLGHLQTIVRTYLQQKG
jgi:PAS domain S-box-containing protein